MEGVSDNSETEDEEMMTIYDKDDVPYDQIPHYYVAKEDFYDLVDPEYDPFVPPSWSSSTHSTAPNDNVSSSAEEVAESAVGTNPVSPKAHC